MLRAASTISYAQILSSSVRSVLGIAEVTKQADTEKPVKRRGKYWALSADQCAICAEDASFRMIDPRHDMYTTSSWSVLSSSQPKPLDEPPQFFLHTPYITSCLHQYCYVCISERMLRAGDEREPVWECLRCEAMVLNADRVDMGTSEESRSDADVDLEETSVENEGFLTTRSD